MAGRETNAAADEGDVRSPRLCFWYGYAIESTQSFHVQPRWIHQQGSVRQGRASRLEVQAVAHRHGDHLVAVAAHDGFQRRHPGAIRPRGHAHEQSAAQAQHVCGTDAKAPLPKLASDSGAPPAVAAAQPAPAKADSIKAPAPVAAATGTVRTDSMTPAVDQVAWADSVQKAKETEMCSLSNSAIFVARARL